MGYVVLYITNNREFNPRRGILVIWGTELNSDVPRLVGMNVMGKIQARSVEAEEMRVTRCFGFARVAGSKPVVVRAKFTRVIAVTRRKDSVRDHVLIETLQYNSAHIPVNIILANTITKNPQIGIYEFKMVNLSNENI